MAIITVPLDSETREFIEEVMATHHDRLARAGVTVHGWWKSSTDEDKPALKHHGYPALATIKVNSEEARQHGQADALVRIDRDRWQGMTAARRRALIDHELCHLDLVTDEDGMPKLDDAGRPRLRMVPHDFECGVFDAVVRRHGEESPDHQALKQAGERLTQKLLAFSEAV